MTKTKPDQEAKAHAISGVDPDTVAHVADTAKAEGLPPSLANEILEDGIAAGVAPEKLEEVADEAVRVEREDRSSAR